MSVKRALKIVDGAEDVLRSIDAYTPKRVVTRAHGLVMRALREIREELEPRRGRFGERKLRVIR